MRRLSACVAASVFLLIGPARGQGLELPQALSTAAQQPAANAAVSIALAERIPSRNFAPVPWVVLPRAAARELHARVRFYDAVLADLEEGALNERIAIAFIRFERAREQNKAGALALHALDAQYRELVSRRDAARVAQRDARSLLAIAMGQPGRLPGDLIEPAVGASAAATEPRVARPRASDSGAVMRAHAAFSMQQLAEHATGSALVAARTQLEAAEARQEQQRGSFNDGASGLDLGDAMADVAAAQLELRRAQFRADVYARIAAALAAMP